MPYPPTFQSSPNEDPVHLNPSSQLTASYIDYDTVIALPLSAQTLHRLAVCPYFHSDLLSISGLCPHIPSQPRDNGFRSNLHLHPDSQAQTRGFRLGVLQPPRSSTNKPFDCQFVPTGVKRTSRRESEPSSRRGGTFRGSDHSCGLYGTPDLLPESRTIRNTRSGSMSAHIISQRE